jgi:hypothetical protein
MDRLRDRITGSLLASFADAKRLAEPFAHWYLTKVLPDDVAARLEGLPVQPPSGTRSDGRRDTCTEARVYFDAAMQDAHPDCRAVAEAFQTPDVARAVETAFGTELTGCHVRAEYARDVCGFWLEPHTDLGVKRFTLLLYLSDGPGHEDLGTDIYDASRRPVARAPFAPNQATAFVPSHNTWHGFEPRPINGVRKSLIVNYVGPEWRAREQLAFPDTPVPV